MLTRIPEFISIGHDSLDEDFANNVEFFIFESETLKKTNREAYNWIQKFIGKTKKTGDHK